MSYAAPSDDDFVTIREVPHRSLIKLSFAFALGTTMFVLLYHLLVWPLGLPGPYIWFGSDNRLFDIIHAGISTGLAVFLVSIFGVLVVKLAARWTDLFNFKLRIR